MSLERTIKTLATIGLSQTEAEIYIYLSTKGPQNARNIGEALQLYKQQIYRSLKNLNCKGCLKVTLERPALFSAEPFEKVLDQFVKEKREEAHRILKNKDECLSYWHSMIEKDNAK